jgi:hypothetical protein
MTSDDPWYNKALTLLMLAAVYLPTRIPCVWRKWNRWYLSHYTPSEVYVTKGVL